MAQSRARDCGRVEGVRSRPAGSVRGQPLRRNGRSGESDEEKERASEKKRPHIGEPGFYSINVKLPHSGRNAIASGIGRPSDYGLGAKGWVTLTFPPGASLPIDDLKRRIEESYCAVAPSTLVKQLKASRGMPVKRRKSSR